MQQTTDRLRDIRRGTRRAALVLAVGLGSAAVLPSLATAAIYIDPVLLDHQDRTTVQRLVVAEAVGNGSVPVPLALAVVDVESGFVSRTLDSSGAIGLMQILPATAESEFGAAADTLWDPATNVRLGLRRLAGLHDRYDGDWELALSHFRGGELAKANGRYRAHDYTRAYVERVIRCWRRYQRDRLVRAWIREARGESRFVADDAPRFGGGTAYESGSAHWRPAYAPRLPHYRYRGHDRLAEGCDETAAPGWPRGYRFNGGGRWSAVEGGFSAGFRSRGGRWKAVTGGTRFR